jgi:predicted XRE-type DNA-binding protein
MKPKTTAKRGRKAAISHKRATSRTRRVGQATSQYTPLPSSTHVTPPGGNVFTDLGFAPEEAENLRVRSDLMIALRRAIDGVTQIDAATLLGVSQPRISELRRGKIDKFTIDTLVNMLARAGVQTRVSLKRTRRPAA